MSVPEPSKILTPWATSGLKNTIPAAANPVTGNAGYDQGFPAINMTPKEAGGIPPFGQDFNGVLYEITNILRYMQAGGAQTYNATLSTAIGGYPKGATVIGTDGVSEYRSLIDSNTSNPNSGGSDWAKNDSDRFLFLASANGYQKLPSGVIIQWGVSAGSPTSVPVTFPIAFPSVCRHVSSSDWGTGAAVFPLKRSMWQFSDLTATGFTANNLGAINQASPGAAPTWVSSGPSSCPWFAIGY